MQFKLNLGASLEIKERLAKRIAKSGIASRREAERLILAGKISVNGHPVTTPVFFVDAHSIITIDGKEIFPQKNDIIIWKFYKPKGIITTKRDPQNRKTIFDCLNIKNQRVIYIGRLDYNSEGLLLLTNNGDVARKLELPHTALKRVYKVRIFGKLSEDSIKQLKYGVTINNIKYGPVEVILDSPHKTTKDNTKISSNSWITVILSEGKNREIRKLMEHFGCTVNRLIRISYGPFTLGNLRPGEISSINENLVKTFIKSIGIFT